MRDIKEALRTVEKAVGMSEAKIRRRNILANRQNQNQKQNELGCSELATKATTRFSDCSLVMAG
jgi:hypothetical protein